MFRKIRGRYNTVERCGADNCQDHPEEVGKARRRGFKNDSEAKTAADEWLAKSEN